MVRRAEVRRGESRAMKGGRDNYFFLRALRTALCPPHTFAVGSILLLTSLSLSPLHFSSPLLPLCSSLPGLTGAERV